MATDICVVTSVINELVSRAEGATASGTHVQDAHLASRIGTAIMRKPLEEAMVIAAA
jgi:F420-0:gamma-glutamyl ligase